MAENKTIACNLTLDEINALALTVKENGLDKIKIKNGDSEIVIEATKKCSHNETMMPYFMGMPTMMNSQPQVNAPQSSDFAQEKTQEVAEVISGNVVKSPIVGTFYSAPAPDKAPFVKVGDTVKKGDVIMIIESMKLMNEVQSEFDGVVEKIIAVEGQAVEYDEPLMIIK